MSVYHEVFCVKCESKLCEMWCRRWEQIKQEKKEQLNILIEYAKKEKAGFEFEVIGTCDSRIQEVKSCILSKEVSKASFPLSQDGLKSLREAMKTNRLEFLRDLVVSVTDINQWEKMVTLCAPKECCKDLDVATEKIREFVGEHIDVTGVISSSDPIVQLSMKSPTFFDRYLTDAKDEAKRNKVVVNVLEGAKPRIQISGNKCSLEVTKPIISRLTIEAIEQNIGVREINLKSIYIPVFAMPEFSQLKSGLMDKFCVGCSVPMSELISSFIIQPPNSENSIDIDIVKVTSFWKMLMPL